MTPKNLLSIEELSELSATIHEFLKQEVHTDDIEVAIERGHELVAYMANTGKMLADARYHRDSAVKQSTLNIVKAPGVSKLPASTINELIKAETKDLNYLVNFIEQLDKETKYQVEWLRTCVSKGKEEMRLQNSFIGNQRA